MGDLESVGARRAAHLFGRNSALIEQTRIVVDTQANADLSQTNWEISPLIDTAVLQDQRAGYLREALATRVVRRELGRDDRDDE
ncbi:hypothetical protein [Nocardia sp. NPDC050718]|uniref:hypothetical protein n=1 Tax=Nocardia sp. NPDC050718 TaxID=3155788 RepID=UPI00340D8BD1